MRWQEGRRSENVEDRRRASVGPVVGGGVGVLVVGLIALFLTGDPSALLRGLAGGGDPSAPAASGASGCCASSSGRWRCS